VGSSNGTGQSKTFDLYLNPKTTVWDAKSMKEKIFNNLYSSVIVCDIIYDPKDIQEPDMQALPNTISVGFYLMNLV